MARDDRRPGPTAVEQFDTHRDCCRAAASIALRPSPLPAAPAHTVEFRPRPRVRGQNAGESARPRCHGRVYDPGFWGKGEELKAGRGSMSGLMTFRLVLDVSFLARRNPRESSTRRNNLRFVVTGVPGNGGGGHRDGFPHP